MPDVDGAECEHTVARSEASSTGTAPLPTSTWRASKDQPIRMPKRRPLDFAFAPGNGLVLSYSWGNVCARARARKRSIAFRQRNALPPSSPLPFPSLSSLVSSAKDGPLPGAKVEPVTSPTALLFARTLAVRQLMADWATGRSASGRALH